MAPQPSAQFNQILGDGAIINALKKGGAKTEGGMSQGDVFRNLLSGLVTTGKKSDLSALVTKAAAAAKKTTDAVLQITPEFLNVLKNLTPDELNKMPPELAALVVKQLSAEAALDSKGADLLQTLSVLAANISDEAPDMYKVIEDPKLAEFLAGLPHAQTLDNTPVPTAPLTAIFTIIPAAQVKSAPSITSSPAILEPNEDLLQQITLLPANTITIADLDGDGFQALKKLAFADIAPYLTMPRTVRVDNGAVMKVAQGPSFLNEENTDSALMAAIAGLFPALQQNALTQGQQTADDTKTPIFLDASILASAQNQAAATPAKPADLFAALLGLRMANNNNADGTDTKAPFVPTGEASAAAPQTAPATPQAAANALLQAASQHANAAHASQQAAIQQTAEAFKGLDQTITTGFINETADDFSGALRIASDPSLPSAAASTLTAARAATLPHPATHMVSVALQNMSAGQTDKQITIHLDPGSLGKIKITMEFGENNTLKAKLLAERPETISLLQKDAAVLERALQNSGFDAARSSLSFDLANGDTFSGAMNGGQQGGQNGGSKRKSDDGTEFATIETLMPIFVDPETGLTHVNVVV